MSEVDQKSAHSGSVIDDNQNHQAPEEEWYDQGFDLSDEADINDSGMSQDFSINLNLVKSASEQFSSTDRDPQRAKLSDLNIKDPSLVSAAQDQRLEARQETIQVGGAGPKVMGDGPSREYQFNQAVKPSDVRPSYIPLGKNEEFKEKSPATTYTSEYVGKPQEKSTFYTSEYVGKPHTQQTQEAMPTPIDDGDSEYGTGSRFIQEKGISAADVRFLRAMRTNSEAEVPVAKILQGNNVVQNGANTAKTTKVAQNAQPQTVRESSQFENSVATDVKHIQPFSRNNQYQTNANDARLAMQAAAQAARQSDARLANRQSTAAQDARFLRAQRVNNQSQQRSGEAYNAMQMAAQAARASDARLATQSRYVSPYNSGVAMQNNEEQGAKNDVAYNAFQAAASAAKQSDASLAPQPNNLYTHSTQVVAGETAFNAFQAAAMAAQNSDARVAAQMQANMTQVAPAFMPMGNMANMQGGNPQSYMQMAQMGQVHGMPMQGVPVHGMQNMAMMQGMPMQGMPMQAMPGQVVPMQGVPHQAGSLMPVPAGGAMPVAQSAIVGTEGFTPQQAVMSNNAQANNAFQAASLEAMNSQHSVRPRDPTDTNANSNKTLEQLAREYPELGPEDLVKLRRSSNRCHLVTRIPIYDSHSNIAIYELKFTSGRVFQINALKSQHVYHVLFGYFIRRGISCFIGRNKLAMVMMPITYDLINYIDSFSANRLILRICPDQPVTPSALHLLTSLKRSGMHFAIDLMLLLKKDWNKAIVSIEYVMIDLSTKVREQINVFQRIKTKAPWVKSIGYNDVNHDGYILLSKHLIDYLDAPFWSPKLNFNQDLSAFYPAQDQSLAMINEMFKDQPNYQIFLKFLSHNDMVSRNLAVFLYRFRHVSPRQIQNIQDLYQCLIENSANRSFSVVIGYSLLQLYCRSASISSQSVLQEFYSQALIRGYFAEYMAKVFEDHEVERFAFQAGMFSLLHLFLLREEVEVLIDETFEPIINRIYGENELLTDIIDCSKALEAVDLVSVFKFIQKYQLPPASVLVSYEKGIMRTNELLIVLNLVPNRSN